MTVLYSSDKCILKFSKKHNSSDYYIKRSNRMAVKHIPTNEVHSGTKGGSTGCGFDTKLHPDHWVSSSQKITCKKNGCKN